MSVQDKGLGSQKCLSRLRVGLVGAGRWGRIYIKTLAQVDDIVLARLCSRNPASAELVPATCTISADWREMIEHDDLDGVILATPAAAHAEAVEACLRMGLPVMVEKPLTQSLAEAEHLGRIAEEFPTPVLVDHTQLFHPGYVKLKELAASLGPITYLCSTGGNWGPFRSDISPLWDYGPHDVAFFLDLLGASPESVQLVHHERKQLPEGLGENVLVRFTFPGMILADMFVGTMMPVKKRLLEVHFARHILRLDDRADDKLQLVERARPERHEAVGHGSDMPLTRAVKAFAAAIRKQTAEHLGLGLGIEVVRVLDEASRAMPGPD